MLKEGFFIKYFILDYVIGLYVSVSVFVGKVSMKIEYMMVSVDFVDIIVKGKGGYGVYLYIIIDFVVIVLCIVLVL